MQKPESSTACTGELLALPDAPVHRGVAPRLQLFPQPRVAPYWSTCHCVRLCLIGVEFLCAHNCGARIMMPLTVINGNETALAFLQVVSHFRPREHETATARVPALS